jgi:hypothetical protein
LNEAEFNKVLLEDLELNHFFVCASVSSKMTLDFFINISLLFTVAIATTPGFTEIFSLSFGAIAHSADF